MPSRTSPRKPLSNRWYTGSGDDGYTRLVGTQRVPKYGLRTEAIGQLDELQAVLGTCRAGPLSQETKDVIIIIERHLYELMGELAFTPNHAKPLSQIEAHHVSWLEQQISDLGESVPAFTGFLVPGDSQAGALLNLARTVARRAERAVAHLMAEETASDTAIQYLNRLSSLLFVMVCYEDMLLNVEKPSTSRDNT